jgi:hypothetical protein
MAKATNPRKPARDKRKGSAAAKRTASKRATRARKFSASSSHPRGAARVIGRPSDRALPRARRAQGSGTASVVMPSAPEPPRSPPPLPVPIASFTF